MTTARHWASIDAQRARLEAKREAEQRDRDERRDALGYWPRVEREPAPHLSRAEVRAAVAEFAALVDWRTLQPIGSGATDAEVCELAERRALLVGRELGAISAPLQPRELAEWINERARALDARPFDWPGQGEGAAPDPERLAGMVARIQCRLWWRRQLRRAVVRKREDEGRERGEVCARRQLYVTDDTLRRRLAANARNAAILEATEIESADGEVISLAQAAGASVANKGIRRGELMTRIRGCEEWAEARGMVGLFTTHTCPSRFHPQRHGGGPNPRHDGSNPREAQQWLCKTWARARAALHRLRVPFFGFRVAEPHHDACPHWHMLLWTGADHIETLRATLRRYWLAEDGDEWGAEAHRFKAVPMERGGASGYIAKYIAKNIDDAGAVADEGQRDEWADGAGDLFGGSAALRVEAWAAAWGIRQFQAIGQPPVTVWRELRRITTEAVAGASELVKTAHRAAHRDGLRRACWRTYMEAQGGTSTGRGYAVRLVVEGEPRPGRYGITEARMVVGVEDAARPGEWVLSSRKQWKPRGTWADAEREPPGLRGRAAWGWGSHWAKPWGEAAQPPCPPWTRLNNCTQRGALRRELAALRGAARDPEPGAGQGSTDHEHFQHPRPPDRIDRLGRFLGRL